jgi:hypothetical protein
MTLFKQALNTIRTRLEKALRYQGVRVGASAGVGGNDIAYDFHINWRNVGVNEFKLILMFLNS